MVIRQILAIVFIPLIILSSGGMNIFRHYCHFHHHAFYSILQQPSCNDAESHTCSHCGHDECRVILDSDRCENTHLFIQTVKHPAPSPVSHINFSQAAQHLLSVLFFTPFLKNEIEPSIATGGKGLVFWDTGIFRDRGAAFFPILFSSLKIDC